MSHAKSKEMRSISRVKGTCSLAGNAERAPAVRDAASAVFAEYEAKAPSGRDAHNEVGHGVVGQRPKVLTKEHK